MPQRRSTRYPRPSVAAPEETDDSPRGQRQEITCPWCDGGGTRLPSEHDAQARFKGEQAQPQPDGPPEPEAA
jgi:hypothetical protein